MTKNDIDATPNPARPLFAIGDLHGCAAKLDEMLDLIAQTLVDNGMEDVDIVALGDYIDRGEDSRGVIQVLIDFEAAYPDLLTPIMGNHEKMLLDFLDKPEERGGRFLRYGGLQTLASFGVGNVTERSRPDAIAKAAQTLRDTMPEGMEQWLRDLPLWKQSGDVICVHAAMDPVVPPELQESRHMLWGHSFFYKAPRPDGLWIVHGHDPVDVPTVKDRRVACDTGAYYSGRLTAAMLTPQQPVQFLTV